MCGWGFNLKLVQTPNCKVFFFCFVLFCFVFFVLFLFLFLFFCFVLFFLLFLFCFVVVFVLLLFFFCFVLFFLLLESITKVLKYSGVVVADLCTSKPLQRTKRPTMFRSVCEINDQQESAHFIYLFFL